METPDIGISYHESLPRGLFKDFEEMIPHDYCKVLVEERPDEGPYMCAEWFITPAVVAFIAAGYFNGILSEMGKSHGSYGDTHLLKISKQTPNQ